MSLFKIVNQEGEMIGHAFSQVQCDRLLERFRQEEGLLLSHAIHMPPGTKLMDLFKTDSDDDRDRVEIDANLGLNPNQVV